MTVILWLRWRRYWLARKVYDRLRPWVIREGDALVAIEFNGLNSGPCCEFAGLRGDYRCRGECGGKGRT